MRSGIPPAPAPDASPAKGRKPESRIGFPLLVLLGAVAIPPPAPGASELLHIPCLCVFRRWTGIPCAGCGLTRALVCLAHGRIQESFGLHPLAIPVFVALVVCAVARLMGRPLRLPYRLVNVGSVVAVVALMLVWIGRLAHWLPWPP